MNNKFVWPDHNKIEILEDPNPPDKRIFWATKKLELSPLSKEEQEDYDRKQANIDEMIKEGRLIIKEFKNDNT